MMNGPVFIIQLDAVVVFLEKVRSAAVRAHDRFCHHSSDIHTLQSWYSDGKAALSSECSGSIRRRDIFLFSAVRCGRSSLKNKLFFGIFTGQLYHSKVHFAK